MSSPAPSACSLRARRPLATSGVRTVALALLWLGVATPAEAQIRGQPPVRQSQGWWFSGGAAGLVLGTITDGASQSRWRFGNDPLWQFRATLEKSRDATTTLGVSAGYGVVDLTVEPLAARAVVTDALDGPCLVACAAQVETWQAMGQFRAGGGPGFHTVIEAQGGVMGFRNLRRRDGGAPIPGKTQQFDLAGSLGFGFGYTLSPGTAVALVQDFGIGWHSPADLPEDTGRTWRVRTTRAALRFRF
jgi:hypothetical protein